MGFFKKIWKPQYFRALPYSIWFNLRHLPFRQAIHLPVLLYKARVYGNGSFIIDGTVHTGMIRLGFNQVGIFPHDGITIENLGKITFHGNTAIANHSFISVGRKGRLEIGGGFDASACKIVCYDEIVFERNVSLGWGSLCIDTDFHKVKYCKGGESVGHGKIRIGQNCWIGNGSKLYKNVTIPHHCIIGADTILNRHQDFEPYSLICNERTTVMKINGIYRDWDDDEIEY